MMSPPLQRLIAISARQHALRVASLGQFGCSGNEIVNDQPKRRSVSQLSNQGKHLSHKPSDGFIAELRVA
jgi:hypothetical protein